MHRSLLTAKVNLERIRTRTFGGSVSFEASRFISDRATSKYDKPVRTDEGVIVHQSDPSAHSSGQGLVWGSVLWPSGTCLAKYMSYRSETSCDLPDMTLLDLGCGKGVVGLTCAKLGARHVTLSDSATDLYPILRKSVAENHLSDRIDIHNLDWRDVTTFLDPSRRPYDMILAADVLYAGMDGLFARALASHLPSKKEVGAVSSSSRGPTEAIIACPNRKDSPLLNFFGICKRLGLSLDRLENATGSAAGASPGMSAMEAYSETKFVSLGYDDDDEEERHHRWRIVAESPTFSSRNKDMIQLFRVRRRDGQAEDARQIRRVGRLQP